ncbi:MAG: LuxR C-terminal-related transcriptional regulator, partial [Candidatus Methanomethylicaceae archaeon]
TCWMCSPAGTGGATADHGGAENQEIAARLGLSERTAAFHVSNILQKLEARSRTEAVVKAKEQGIIG